MNLERQKIAAMFCRSLERNCASERKKATQLELSGFAHKWSFVRNPLVLEKLFLLEKSQY